MNAIDIKNKLNVRSLVIVAALALPVVLLALVVHHGESKPQHYATAAVRPHPTLEQARAETRRRLAEVEKMTPAQWAEERRRHPWAARTAQDAVRWNTQHLAKLNAMTPQQWEAQFHPRPKQPPRHPAVAQPAVLPHTPEQATLPPISR